MGGYKHGGRGEEVSKSLKMGVKVIEESANIVGGGDCVCLSPLLSRSLPPFIGQGERGEGPTSTSTVCATGARTGEHGAGRAVVLDPGRGFMASSGFCGCHGRPCACPGVVSRGGAAVIRAQPPAAGWFEGVTGGEGR